MSQNDMVIANQTTPLFRADLNTALQALVSQNSGSTAPTTTYANMIWYDTLNNILKMRSEADDAWISIGTLDQGTNSFTPSGLSAKADLASPTFTGVPAAPTASVGTSTTQLATTAFVTAGVFQSAELAYTHASLVTVAHGLGATPKSVVLTQICKTADAGYSVGDTLAVDGVWVSGSNNYGATVYADPRIFLYPL